MKDWIIENKVELGTIKAAIDNITSKKLPIDIAGLSAKGTNSKQYNLNDNKEDLGKVLEYLIYCVKNLIDNNLTDHRKKGLGINELIPHNIWTVYGDEGSYHTLHNHHINEDIKLSMVLYLSIPEEDGMFYCVGRDNKCKNLIRHIIPQVGTILIFPSNLLHGAYPQGKGLRQTFNIDFSIK